MSTNPAALLNAKIETFPSLPSVVTRIMELTADPDSSVEDLLSVIQFDQSLTATVLKMSNSAFFGQVRQVSSLKQAISVLGMNEIQNIAVAKAIFNSFRTIEEAGSVFNMRTFWMHSFVCGLSAKLFSDATGVPGEDLFIAGLIHDIGKLVIMLTLPLEFAGIVTSSDSQPYKTHVVENCAIGVNHCMIGRSLLKRWMFPETLVMAAGYHHFPEKAEGSNVFPAVIYMADIMAYMDSRPEDDMAPELIEMAAGEKIADVAELAGIEWSRALMESHLKELTVLKNQALETFEIMLS